MLTDEASLGAILAVLFIVTTAVFMVGAFTKAGEYSNKFCKAYPEFCGKVQSDEDARALASNIALACALESVANGQESACMANFQSLAGDKADKVTDKGVNEPFMKCENAKTKALVTQGYNSGPPPSDRHFNCEPVVLAGGREGTKGGFCYYCPTGTPVAETNECQVWTCDLQNFQLPQTFDDIGPDEWIGGFGDPQYLSYYQTFPPGENLAWSEYSDWFQGTSTVVFGTMCASALIRPVKQVQKWTGGFGPGATTAIVGERAGRFQLVGEAARDFLGSVSAVLPGIAGKLGRISTALSQAYITNPAGKAQALAILKNDLHDDLIVGLEKFLGVVETKAPKLLSSTATKTGVTAVGAKTAEYFDKRFESEIGKFVKDAPNSMVLQKALFDSTPVAFDNTEEFNLEGITLQKGMPV
ncbi:MAG: hypothetical protein HY519_03245, partial [Candidatus Aenigmarchaeota archaeon]|nr:hypothetical protein [Candidatus Aenigmarchaeota archaeon]